jgi:hypothetical protein
VEIVIKNVLKMKSFLFFVILLFNNSQDQIRWENAKNWRLYKMPSYIGLRISLDSLPAFKSIPLDVERMKIFLKDLQEIKNTNPVWTGLYVATCDLDNKKRKLLFSRYGGFFFDENSKSYYQIDENLRQEWINFLNASSKSIEVN